MYTSLDVRQNRVNIFGSFIDRPIRQNAEWPRFLAHPVDNDWYDVQSLNDVVTVRIGVG